MNKTVKIVSLTAIIASILALLYVIFLFFVPNFSLKSQGKQYLFIRDNQTYAGVTAQLQEKTNVFSMFTFNQAASILGYKTGIKPGRYRIKSGANNFTLLRALRSGHQTPVELKLNNIRTKEQLAQRLSKELMPDSMQFITLLNDTAFLAKYHLNPYNSIAVFLPNTYNIYWNTDVEKVFEKMHKEYDKFWTDTRKQQAAAIPLSETEVITLASIVDGESNSAAEKPIIAGLYINRLQKNMPLQADPTVIFAAGDFSIKRVTSAYTSIQSPYNTYKNKGLPPGPIRIPELKTIEAVLNYDKNDYIYMCAKEALNGEHNFAATWAEHQINAKRYQEALNERGIR